MKTSTKISIGLGVTAAAGVVTAVVISDKVINKVQTLKNRHQVKSFVQDKFNGNETLLDIVDHLDDKDIASLIKVSDKVKAGKQSVTSYGENIKETTENVKDKLYDLADHMM
ncbi:MAG TPA: hypothetical protein H9829_06340 [Candidatus Tetragenococcus pullicola]|nr:hypothetical protein [Candidatus Tetragenococcus pullicola]